MHPADTRIARLSAPAHFGARHAMLVGKHFSSGFHCEGNDEQADPKCNRCERDRLAESVHSADKRGHRKVDPRGNEATERSRERKRCRAHRGPVLLR